MGEHTKQTDAENRSVHTNDDKDTQAQSTFGSTRRTVLTGLATVTAGTIFSSAASAGSPEAVPVPKVKGPIGGQPMTGAVHDISEYGYVEDEYFVKGKARPLGPIDPYPVEERENPSEEAATYRTRMLVYRPKDECDFNGTVVVEWPNVSTGRDAPVTWINTFDYAMREGYAVVVASAQKVGVDDSHTDQDLKTTMPDRYGSLHHPGDEYSYDIFAQAIKALLDQSRSAPPHHASGNASAHRRGKAGGCVDPLHGLDVQRIVATGMSQSAGYLRYYINELQADQNLIDGFLPFVTSRTPAEEDDIRDDLVPVMWVMSESEADQDRRDDSGLFRLWEVAGASHINYWLVHWAQAMDARDFGEDNPPWNADVAGQYGQRADGTYGVCGVNYFPMRYAYRAALDQLQDWLIDDETPPSAPRIERETVDGSVTVKRDEYGNAKGGLRLPPIDVPLAHYDVTCGAYGQTFRLEDETVSNLYSNQEDYLDQFEDAVDSAVDSGYLLSEDAENLLQRATKADLNT